MTFKIRQGFLEFYVYIVHFKCTILKLLFLHIKGFSSDVQPKYFRKYECICNMYGLPMEFIM